MADESRFVPGVYNYCDRWCERCAFALRCRNFSIIEELTNPETHDLENAKFWDAISESSEHAFDPGQDDEEEFECDWDIDDEELDRLMDEDNACGAIARSHPIAILSNRYMERIDEWMDGAEGSIEKKQSELDARGRNEEEGMAPFLEAVDIEDAIEVIRWYQYFIHVKLMRALHGREEGDALAEEYDFPKDSDGSAKIALIAMDRSIGAWATLRNLIPDESAAILDLLGMLNRLRKDTEHEFPDARAFVRPGFDEVR